jgi:hypothetical protein
MHCCEKFTVVVVDDDGGQQPRLKFGSSSCAFSNSDPNNSTANIFSRINLFIQVTRHCPSIGIMGWS